MRLSAFLANTLGSRAYKTLCFPKNSRVSFLGMGSYIIFLHTSSKHATIEPGLCGLIPENMTPQMHLVHVDKNSTSHVIFY